jgi:hypothetical protein
MCFRIVDKKLPQTGVGCGYISAAKVTVGTYGCCDWIVTIFYFFLLLGRLLLLVWSGIGVETMGIESRGFI